MNPLAEKIYATVQRIPSGSVATYGDVAQVVGCSPRQVGFWLHRNPQPKTIPCHRVVFADGSLASAFAFGGRKGQSACLVAEGVQCETFKVDLECYRANQKDLN